MKQLDLLKIWRCNPFFVLELRSDATRIEVERAGQRLLSMFNIGSVGVAEYVTPFGSAMRDADMVRQALSQLRDADQRVTYELWANFSTHNSPIEIFESTSARNEQVATSKLSDTWSKL